MHPDLWAKNGGGVDVPRVVFISQKMPQMPEAGAGVRHSPCAAVTNSAPPLLLYSYLLPLLLEKRNQSQFLEREKKTRVWTLAFSSLPSTC